MDETLIRCIFNYIDEHIHEKIGLKDLAELVGYSPFYFSKLFSETTGMSITGYIRMRKLQYSLSSLLHGMKVIDVSLLYAFDSHEGFTRSFSQLFGSTPSTVRKYLSSYQVPAYSIPVEMIKRKDEPMLKEQNLQNNMHQLVYEILKNCFEEAAAGYCNKITITIFSNNTISISDNGRGIPLSENTHVSQEVLDKILAGHPISNLEYAQMGDFSQCSLQIINSLCENLHINVYRDNKWFQQDYIRGIAQHEATCCNLEHDSGTEIIFRPDTAIFSNTCFSKESIQKWISENHAKNLVTFS